MRAYVRVCMGGHSLTTACARSENNLECWSFQFVRDKVSIACVGFKPLGILLASPSHFL